MIIELFGIPSCGKTTISDKFLKENINYSNPLNLYLYNKSRLKQNVNKIKLSIYFVKFNLKKSIKIVRLFNKIKFQSKITRIKMELYLFTTLGLIFKVKEDIIKERNYILDEGINQVIWGISYNSYDSEHDIKILYEELVPYIGDEVWCINIEKEIAKKRLLDRNKPGGSELEKDIKDNDKFLDKSINIFNKIIEDFIRNKGINTVFIENN